LTGLADNLRRNLNRPGIDLQTRAHLASLQVDVQRALEAKIVLPG